MSIRSMLADHHVLDHVVVPREIDILLSSLTPATIAQSPADPSIYEGDVNIDLDQNKSPLPGFDFHLALPTQDITTIPFKLKLSTNPWGFQFWLVLSEEGRVNAVFALLDKLPGLGLTGATVQTDAASGQVSLVPTGKAPVLVCPSPEPGSRLKPSLLVSGTAATPAGLRFTPDTNSTEGIVSVAFDPPAVVFGASKVGFQCKAFIIDDSDVAKGDGEGATAWPASAGPFPPDQPGWRGFLARQVSFYLPPEVPLFGGQEIRGHFAIPFGAGGVEMVLEAKVDKKDTQGGAAGHPGYSVRIECIDPTAQGLSGLVPTLITATMDIPVKDQSLPLRMLGQLNFLGGDPLRATARFARDPVNDPGTLRVAVGLTAEGQDGLVAVVTERGAGRFEPAKLFNTAAAMATALVANADAEKENGKYYLPEIAAAGAALSSLFEPESRFVLHGAEIESSGHGLPVGKEVSLLLDYSVAVRVTKLGVPGGISVQMVPDQPMRIRLRKVKLRIDMTKSGLDMFDLDYDRAEMEVENPGAWQLEGFEKLFDVIGSRSGRGSAWVEVDLRFKLNLGPIKVSGLTIRGTLVGGTPTVSVTGIGLAIDVPGVVSGEGFLHLADGGFDAHILASVVPLELNADATIMYKEPGPGRPEAMIFLALGVDLPAPLPLANSGFGLFGLEGMFGIAVKPRYPAEGDPVMRQLRWKHRPPDDFDFARGQLLIGVGAVVGTLPDFGFTFGAKAEIVVSVPDVAIRGALNGTVMSPRPQITKPSDDVPPGVSFVGFIGIDSQAADFAVLGALNLKPLIDIRLPLVGHFPVSGDTSDWYTYLGADGYKGQGRGIGPISARVLPDIIDFSADAYLMIRGKGIENWPVSKPFVNYSDGFVIAFGFSMHQTFGFRPVAWAELSLGLDLLFAPNPLTFAGHGGASGSLHLGPFSLGVSAEATFMAVRSDVYLWAKVTGRIELFFFDVEGSVTISFGGKEPTPGLPDADQHPLDRLERQPDGSVRRLGSTPILTDDSYRVVGHLVEDPAQLTPEMQVWPDILISIPFAFAPEVAAAPGGHFPGINQTHAPIPGKRLGSQMLRYVWTLNGVSLFDVTDVDDKYSDGTPYAAELPAAWQAPRGDAGVTELVLFSKTQDLWVNRRPDAGKGIGDPIRDNARLCQRTFEAKPAWAVGALAQPAAEGFLLPTSPQSLDPLASAIDTTMRHLALTGTGAEIPLDRAADLPLPLSLAPPAVSRFAPRDVGVGRNFDGEIMPQNLTVPASAGWEVIAELPFRAQMIRLDPAEPISEGLLILSGPPEIFRAAERGRGVVVADENGPWGRPDILEIIDGRAYAAVKQNSPWARHITVTWPISASLGVTGLRGLAQAAVAAAEQATAGTAAAAADLANAMLKPFKLLTLPIEKDRRTVLQPGRIYRLDIEMTWAGERFEQGGTTPVQQRGPEEYYRAPGEEAANTPTRRQLFFATTAAKPLHKVTSGMNAFAKFAYRTQDSFTAEMLERYLGGYAPGQSEQFRFTKDAVATHFTQAHVPVLADAYGLKVVTAVRRIDRPGEEYANPLLLIPEWSHGLDRAYLSATDQHRFDMIAASGCPQPSPGATASVLPDLEPEAWYEVYASLRDKADVKTQVGRLPGVTFRTSRWESPQAMLAALGFTVTAPAAVAAQPVTMGDIAIETAAITGGAVIEDNDQAFQAALSNLGLEGWPVAEAPRVSRLWTKRNGGWLFAGLMLESPEPIHRPGRLEFKDAALAVTIIGIGFDIRRRDAAGTRLLYLAAQPFVVQRPPLPPTRLVLAAAGGPSGYMIPPRQPSFAEES